MKITEIINGKKPSLSFEVFPPKTSETYDSIMGAASSIASLNPDYMSVTYGAGGTNAGYAVEIAEKLNSMNVTPLAHLSCISATKERIGNQLTELKAKGIENILALRGDIPEGFDRNTLEYHHASDLAKEISDFGGFCIGGACYPEMHPESANLRSDLDGLKAKVDSGCEFLVTQMFFDNDIVYNFMYRLLKAGIDVPVVPGIMPITNARQIKRVGGISGTMLPQKFLRIVDRYGDDPAAMKQAGIIFATSQILDLYANGFNAVHVYSMNKPDVAEAIQKNLAEIIK